MGWSTDTVQGLPRQDSTKVLSDRLSTSNGPTYRGVKGRLTASTRTNAAVQDCKESGTADGREAPWNSAVNGEKSLIDLCSCRTKSEVLEEAGGPPEAKNLPGSLRGAPRTRCAGDTAESSQADALMPSKTKGRFDIQSAGHEDLDIRRSFSTRCTRSTIPLHCG